jgi:hypothetical protein
MRTRSRPTTHAQTQTCCEHVAVGIRTKKLPRMGGRKTKPHERSDGTFPTTSRTTTNDNGIRQITAEIWDQGKRRRRGGGAAPHPRAAPRGAPRRRHLRSPAAATAAATSDTAGTGGSAHQGGPGGTFPAASHRGQHPATPAPTLSPLAALDKEDANMARIFRAVGQGIHGEIKSTWKISEGLGVMSHVDEFLMVFSIIHYVRLVRTVARWDSAALLRQRYAAKAFRGRLSACCATVSRARMIKTPSSKSSTSASNSWR